MRISDLKTDPNLERSGVWVQWVGDVRLKLRRSGNDAYRNSVAEDLKPYRALIRADAFPASTLDQIQRGAIARHVIAGWENLTDDEGAQIHYSPETAEKLLRDPSLHDFYEFVLVASSRMENYRAEEAKEDLGNSRSSSTGSANGASSRGSSESSLVAVNGSKPSSASLISRLTSKLRGQPSSKTTTSIGE